MAHPKAAWGIEIGAHAIKAIRLEREGDAVTVSDFAVIPHKKVLTTPDLDKNEMIRISLGQFISQKSLEGEHLVMSVPGHAAFARFAKLPPVEPKKVPDIVKFEAVQQIPFPIDQVEWDYQTFTSEDSPEVEVGIFAITRERVQERLSVYSDVGIAPETLTLSPVAVFNAISYDTELGRGKGPVVFLDIGTSATDLIVAEEGRCWIRTFPLGGTHFTDAIANAFKLSYSKAEKLKKEAASSKYAKQIMQAMRPVFSDLLQDIQRSLGYYQTLHREADLTRIIGIGSTFKIPGLRKFLGQQLQVDIARLDDYRKITVTGREAASFAENAVNMATAYGLALQGVGLGPIDVNLVPVKALRDQIWHAKTKWFAAASVLLTLGAATMFIRPVLDKAALTAAVPAVVNNVITSGEGMQKEYMAIQDAAGFTGANLVGLLEDREIWPQLLVDSTAALGAAEPQDVLLSNDVEAIRSIPAKERRLVQLKDLQGVYRPLEDGKRRIMQVTMMVELSHEKPDIFVNDTVLTWLRENAFREGVPYRILDAVDSPEYEIKVSGWSSNMYDASGKTVETGSVGSGGKAPAKPDGLPGMGEGGPGLSSGSSGGNGVERGDGGGGMRKRRDRVTLDAETLGSGSKGLGVGSDGNRPTVSDPGGGQNTPGWTPPVKPNTPKGQKGNELDDSINVAEMAPVPTRPSMYNAGEVFYVMPITFWVELIDDSKPAPNKDVALRGSTEDVSS